MPVSSLSRKIARKKPCHVQMRGDIPFSIAVQVTGTSHSTGVNHNSLNSINVPMEERRTVLRDNRQSIKIRTWKLLWNNVLLLQRVDFGGGNLDYVAANVLYESSNAPAGNWKSSCNCAGAMGRGSAPFAVFGRMEMLLKRYSVKNRNVPSGMGERWTASTSFRFWRIKRKLKLSNKKIDK